MGPPATFSFSLNEIKQQSPPMLADTDKTMILTTLENPLWILLPTPERKLPQVCISTGGQIDLINLILEPPFLAARITKLMKLEDLAAA